jgi:hypothetical protein
VVSNGGGEHIEEKHKQKRVWENGKKQQKSGSNLQMYLTYKTKVTD